MPRKGRWSPCGLPSNDETRSEMKPLRSLSKRVDTTCFFGTFLKKGHGTSSLLDYEVTTSSATCSRCPTMSSPETVGNVATAMEAVQKDALVMLFEYTGAGNAEMHWQEKQAEANCNKQADHCQEAEDEEDDELKMGNAFRKGSSDQRSGLTDGEKRLIRNSWRKFCEQNPDYGVRIFISMFAKHPEYLQMFPRFRDKELQTLRDDAKFRAHACAVGHQLSAIVECIEDDEVFIELIRKNAANHLPRAGVSPSNFESLFAAALEQMVASNKALMTPATMRAWEKLFKIMNKITRNVYEDAAQFSDATQETSSGDDLSLVDPGAASADHSKSDAVEVFAGCKTAQEPQTCQGTVTGTPVTAAAAAKESAHGAPRTSGRTTTGPTGSVSRTTMRSSSTASEANGFSSKPTCREVAESSQRRTSAPVEKTGSTQAPRAAAQRSLRGAVSSERAGKKSGQDASSHENSDAATL